MAKDLCMHIAATSQSAYLEMISQKNLFRKRKILQWLKQRENPHKRSKKIVTGKLEKYFAASCLIEQPFVKDPDSSVKDLLAKTSAEVGSDLSVGTFLRFQVGENN